MALKAKSTPPNPLESGIQGFLLRHQLRDLGFQIRRAVDVAEDALPVRQPNGGEGVNGILPAKLVFGTASAEILRPGQVMFPDEPLRLVRVVVKIDADHVKAIRVKLPV